MHLAWLIHHWTECDTGSGVAVSLMRVSSRLCCCLLGQTSSVMFRLWMGFPVAAKEGKANCPWHKNSSPWIASSRGQTWSSNFHKTALFVSRPKLWTLASFKSHWLLQQMILETFWVLLSVEHQSLEQDAIEMGIWKVNLSLKGALELLL